MAKFGANFASALWWKILAQTNLRKVNYFWRWWLQINSTNVCVVCYNQLEMFPQDSGLSAHHNTLVPTNIFTSILMSIYTVYLNSTFGMSVPTLPSPPLTMEKCFAAQIHGWHSVEKVKLVEIHCLSIDKTPIRMK